jgi:hypothetical protein
MSEADYPFALFSSQDRVDSFTPQTIRKITGHPPEIPVEEVNSDTFFQGLTQEQEWYGQAEHQTVAQYKSLFKILKENLHGLKVYKLGKIQVDIYIVGTLETGEVLGVSTKAVET